MAEMLLENPIWSKDMIDWLIDGEANYNGTKNEKTESLLASDLDHLLFNFF